MAIAGLTDRKSVEAVEHLFYKVSMKLGTLYKGGKKGARSPGRNLDHFRFEPNPSMSAADQQTLRQIFAKSFGEQPKTITGVVFSGSATQAFDPRMQEFAGGYLTKICDSQTMSYELLKDGTINTDRQPCKKSTTGCKCSRKGQLVFKLKVFLEAGFAGHIELGTGSIDDLIQITATLNRAERAFSGLEGIPFLLSRVEQSTSYRDQNSGTRKKGTQSAVKLLMDPAFERACVQMAENARREEIRQRFGSSSPQAIATNPTNLTTEQRQALWNAAQAKGWGQEEAKAWVGAFGYGKTADIPFDRFGEALEHLRSFVAPSPEPPQWVDGWSDDSDEEEIPNDQTTNTSVVAMDTEVEAKDPQIESEGEEMPF